MEQCKSTFTVVNSVEGVACSNIGNFGGKTIAGGREFSATCYFAATQSGKKFAICR